jgi:hypothetical protein
MKRSRTILLIAAAVAATVFPSQTNARADVMVGMQIQQTSDFYQPLAPYGYWAELPRHGWCWYPAYVDQGWRPYSNGHWVWTDGGWYWESEEPWAWATYHYGRWTWDDYYGWVWVPGTDWAPSWVAWREGGGYVGWAPLPPDIPFDSDGFIYAERIVVPPQFFVFVEYRHFCGRIRPQAIIFNNSVIGCTHHSGRIHRGHEAIVNEGPSLDLIERNNPGRVRHAIIQQRPPADFQRERQQTHKVRTSPATRPQVIRGTSDVADRSAVVRPMPVQPTGDRSQPRPPRPDADRTGRDQGRNVTSERISRRESRPPVSIESRRQENRPAPTPPAPVVIQPKPQPLPPTAAQSSDSDSPKYRRQERYPYSDDARRRRE